MRFNALLLAWLLCFTIKAHSQPTLYGIFVGAVEDPKLAVACQVDIKTMFDRFGSIARSIGYKYKVGVLTKDNFSNESIKSVLDSITCGPDDIIVFYYTGHGYNRAGTSDEFPVLHVDTLQVKTNFPLSGIHQTLLSKKARFCLSIGDCCNALANETPPQERSLVKGTNCNPEIFEQLFLKSRGGVMIASSKRGQFSGASFTNSWYTWAFQESLEYACHYNNQITWQQLLDDSQNRMWSITAARVHKQESVYKLNLLDQSTSPTPVAAVQADTVPNNAPVASTPVVSGNAAPPVEVVNSTTMLTVSTAGQRPDYSLVNKYLTGLANPLISYQTRKAMQLQAGRFFIHNAKVNLYVNDTRVDVLPLQQLMNRYAVSTDKHSVRQVNLVERLSKLDPSGRFYTEIALQEIWE
ncbi:caspase family protein [Spirosoma linguale]|uniref:Peptidase C14 caspase domain-containing protein n=1 Tax=Spirosoma linguale (strain ATCC 33905 / DSM 74 / LMG 10896 / Claus 1) TaxID=504472 RepID=D2QUD7_SPILD|nr:hypothetical protein Slin_6462 [Spirosoma linguale DSM 74]